MSIARKVVKQKPKKRLLDMLTRIKVNFNNIFKKRCRGVKKLDYWCLRSRQGIGSREEICMGHLLFGSKKKRNRRTANGCAGSNE